MFISCSDEAIKPQKYLLVALMKQLSRKNVS